MARIRLGFEQRGYLVPGISLTIVDDLCRTKQRGDLSNGIHTHRGCVSPVCEGCGGGGGGGGGGAVCEACV